MKKLIPLLLLGFFVALAIVIGQRMSTDAMAVVIGVAVGIAASVPTSLLLVALLRKERQAFRHEETPYGAYPPAQLPYQQPNIIVLDPSQLQRPPSEVPLPPQLPDAGLRRIKIVGHDDWS